MISLMVIFPYCTLTIVINGYDRLYQFSIMPSNIYGDILIYYKCDANVHIGRMFAVSRPVEEPAPEPTGPTLPSEPVPEPRGPGHPSVGMRF